MNVVNTQVQKEWGNASTVAYKTAWEASDPKR
jgi:hypothetical protein